jgi:hypothetical protein
MTFGEALERCKKGARIYREGWNGKGQYVELATEISYENPQGDLINADHKSIGNKALAFVGTSGVQLGWLASQADMLADDWSAKNPLYEKDVLEIINRLKLAHESCRHNACGNCPFDKINCERAALDNAMALIELLSKNVWLA